MIHYALRCGSGHDFDGWFKDSVSFDQQAKSGLLDCPICADTRVERALMAPNVRTRRAARAPAEDIRAADTKAAAAAGGNSVVPAGGARPGPLPPDSLPSGPLPSGPLPLGLLPLGPSTSTAVTSALPDQVRAVLQRIRADVERNCDYVGPNFAETARNIASGAEPARPIYGEATQEQEAALAEDGIEVARIPWVPRANS